MKKRLISLTFAITYNLVMSFGQLVPIQNVQSPEIGNLGLYGTIPVSPFTGTPDISIPLYDLKSGNYTLPISMSYHLAAVQPNRQYGVLGMGWNLIAGGYISRIANHIYDEKQSTDGEKYGYYYHHDKMQAVMDNDMSNFDNLVRNSITGNSAYDLCADEFYFDFCGYTGHFYLCPDGTWKVISEQDIKLEFDPDNGGLIRSSELVNENIHIHGKAFSRLKIYQWSNQSQNGWLFNKFTLITPDGCRYEFGGIYATEYSISYYNPNNSDLIPTTWRLAKITTPENRVIQFNYKKDFWKGIPLQCDIQYVPTRSYGTYVSRDQIGWDGMSGYIIFPTVLESITTDNEKVIFNVEKDSLYIHMFENHQVFYKGNGNAVFNPYVSSLYTSDNQYNAFFKVNTSYVEPIRDQIWNQLSSYYLKGLTIDAGVFDDTILVKFSYLDSKRKMLRKVTFSGKAVDDSYSSKSFSFDYYDLDKMPNRFVFPETDSWGYYRGGDIKLSAIPTYAFKPSSTLYIKAGVLSSITYPTGGRTVFEYELNDYNKSIDRFNRTLLSDNGPKNCASGLRIKKIQSLDSDSSVISTKKYYYTTSKAGSVSSGILSKVPCFSINYKFGDKGLTVQSEGGFWPSSLGNTAPIVGYSTVFEETFDKDGKSLGYIKYCFSNYDNDIYGESHLDENSYHATFYEGNAYGYNFTNRSVERGKLLSKQYYDVSGSPQKSINYRYKSTTNDFIPYASQFVVNINPTIGDFYALGWLNKIYTDSYLLQSETDTTFVKPSGCYYHTKKDYAYNKSNLLTSTSELCSDGAYKSTTYTYSVDKPEYDWLVDKHFLSALIEKRVSYRGKNKTEKYDYSMTKDSSVPYIQKISSSYNGNDFKNDYEAVLVDKYGNPVEIVVNGMKSLLYWGMNGQHLNGRVDNFSNRQAIELGMEDAVRYSDYKCYYIETFWKKFFKLPVSAHMYVYNYERRRLLESIIEPTGFTTFYKYDGLNRLREIYHYDYTGEDMTDPFVKRFMHVYDYHYIDKHHEEE